jgi:iron(III) transport system substrate-binding protein
MIQTFKIPAWANKTKTACAAAALAVSGAMSPALAEDFDLEALIAAAKAEGPITIYASTGKIKKAAKAFTAKYGIEAEGSKVKGAAQIDLVVREAQSGNTVGDVIISSDAGATLAQLLGSNMVSSWTPPDLAGDIDDLSKDPLVVWRDPSVWSFNSETTDVCPVSNIWELTGEDWNRRVAMPDPLHKPSIPDWFNQMEMHFDADVAVAYKAHFGTDLDTSSKSATAQWVEAIAKNAPLLTTSDSDVAEAIGTPGQAEPFFGILSSAKYRDTVDGGLSMSICQDIQPYMGFYKPGFGLISNGTKSPNAAKLFLHFMMTEDGVGPMIRDGKMSGNGAIAAHPEEPSGVVQLRDRLTPHVAETGAVDYDMRQDWQDLWRISYNR